MLYYKESVFNIKVDEDLQGRKLLFNTSTSGLCWVDTRIAETFLGKTHIGEEKIDQRLIKLGFVVNENVDEISQYIFERNKYLYDSKPKTMGCVISPTLQCNMNCNYCFQKGAVSKEMIDKSEVDTIVDFIINNIEENDCLERFWIRWFGGEPSLEIDNIIYISEKIIKACQKNSVNYDSMIVSNGLLLEKKIAKQLFEKCKIGVAQITVDGLKDTYAKVKGVPQEYFDIVMKNISELSQFMRVNININISPINEKEIIELIEFIINDESINEKNVRIYPSLIYKYIDELDEDAFFDEDEYQKLLLKYYRYIETRNIWGYFDFDLPRKKYTYCTSMQSNTLCIGPKGYLYRCETCIGQENMKIGSCEEGRYYNKVDLNYVAAHLEEKCKACNILPICGGGCRDRQLYRNIELSCKAKYDEIVGIVKMNLKKRANKNERYMHNRI